MPIIKTSKKENFCIIPNALLNNPKLSFKAKGLVAFLLSKPNNWEVNVSHIVKTSTDGRDAIYSAMKELEEAGYLRRDFVRDQGGKFMQYDYLVYDEPQQENPQPQTEKDEVVKPFPENPDTNKTVFTKTELSKEDKLKNQKIDFCKRVISFASKNPDKYPKLMYFDFSKYWLETNGSVNKMRFQDQKFFEVGKRLATWFGNSDNKKLSDQWQAEKETETINSLLRKLL